MARAEKMDMRIAIGLIAVGALAACSQGGGNGTADGGNGAAGGRPAAGGASGAVALQPGQWESTIQMEAANMPELPPGVTAPAMQPITTRTCITPQQAANPSAEVMAANARQPTGCRTENYSFANGRIEGTSVCNTGGVNMRMTISGEYTPTSYEMTMQSRSEAGGVARDNTMRVSARRIGDCPGG